MAESLKRKASKQGSLEAIELEHMMSLVQKSKKWFHLRQQASRISHAP